MVFITWAKPSHERAGVQDGEQFLTLMAGLATAEAIASVARVEPLVKWPNDLLLDGRKVVGILTEMTTDKLMVPYGKFNDPTQTAAISGSKQIDIQIDFYGPLSGEWCSTAASAMGSEWGYNAFPANIRPLYTTKGLQSPLTTGEQQYESRWTLTASLQYNPVVTVPQQSATVLTVNTLGAVDL